MDLKNKRVTVVGLGNSGVNAALLLRDIGAKVSATNAGSSDELSRVAAELKSKGIDVEIGGHTKGFVEGRDLIVVSPGVENSSPVIRWADELNIPIIGEMEMGFNYCKGKIIAITGTNGKSTVTALIGEILKDGGKDTVVCGNIGNSLCGEIKRIKDATWVVLEVSSFQLERIEKFKPHIAVILNITDDHMDRYAKFDDYFNEKLKIFSNQDEDDILILNRDAANLGRLKDTARSKVLFYGKADIKDDAGAMPLKGLHNLENAAAAALVGKIVGITPESIRKTINGFKGLSHRFETIATVEGVEYIDDSKGTTVDSTLRALESCAKPVVLIAGGKDKNSDYTVIKDLARKKVKHLILIGEATKRIKDALGNAVDTREAKDMTGAVNIARDLAKKGDIVLLSPMCSSFDMFKDYKERGEAFKKAVKNILMITQIKN